MTSHLPAVIVGGGICGLVCAYALRKAGVEAQLLEASPRAGGLIRSERREGYLLELGPQSFSGTRPLRALCTELGIDDELLQAPSTAPRYVLLGGKLQNVPLSPPELLKSPLLGMRTKVALGRDALGNSKPPEEDESIAAFVRRKFTAELLDRLVGPFISGIYAGDPERLSLRSAFPQVYEAEKAAGSIIRGMKRAAESGKEPRESPTLLSFRDGNETLVRALQGKLGAAVRTGIEVVALRRNPTTKAFELRIRPHNQEEALKADNVILATPTDVAAKLLRDVRPEFEPLLSAIAYAPVALVSLGYQQTGIGDPLNGFGFLVPRSEGLRTLGTVWNSSLFPGRTPEGHALLTSFAGGATDIEAASLSPAGLASLVHSEIAPLLSIRQTPAFSNVKVYPRALPQYNLGHSERLSGVERLRQATPGLWLTGNYLRGPSIGACVEHSLAVAEQVLSRSGPGR